MPCPLPSMNLCGHQLPWVDKILHLGNTLTNDTDIVSTDMNIKNARYIVKNIEINHEFYFSAAATCLQVNQIYNSNWFGSILWDLFCPPAFRHESSYNRSINLNIMLNLPLATHRELIEPLSDQQHVNKVLIQSFIQTLKKYGFPKNYFNNFIISSRKQHI